MRPLRLTLEGFTCYKERQPLLDFSSYDLFAIAGPTGSGKSSLLDAMLFALYGRVPRVGKSVSELISLGRDRMSVLLDFRVGDREFRISRVARRGRTTQAQLDELVGGLERAYAGGVQKVDAAVEELLGLRYEAFTQAVILPQGEFAYFLKSAPRERREILRDLLRLSIYERMRKEAFDTSKELSLRERALDERLVQDYGDATEESLEAFRRELEELGGRAERLARELEQDQTELENLRQRAATVEERGSLRREMEKLETKGAEIEAGQVRLEKARRVEPILSLLESEERAAARLDSERSRLEKLREQEEESRRGLEAAEAALALVEKDAERMPQLKEKLRRLDELRGLWEPRLQCERRLETSRRELAGLQNDVDVKTRSAREREETRASMAGQRDELERELMELRYDEELDRRLDAAREEAVALGAARERLEKLSALEREEVAEIDRVEKSRDESHRQVERASVKLREAEARRKESEAAFERSRQQDAVSHLRSALSMGERCPVCEQIVGKKPEPIQGCLLDGLASEIERSRAQEESERAHLGEQEALANTLAERWAAGLKSLSDRRSELDRLERELTEEESRLVELVGETSPYPEPLERFLISKAKHLAALRSRFRAIENRRASLDSELHREQSELGHLTKALALAQEQQEELEARIEEQAQELESYEKQIASVTGGENPIELREQVADELERLELARTSARERKQQATAAQAASAATASSVGDVVEKASRELALLARRVAAAVSEAGLENAAAARSAALPEEAMKELDAAVGSFHREHHRIGRRLSELDGLLDGSDRESLTLGAVEQKENRLREKRESYETSIRRQAELRTRLDALQEKLNRAERLRSEKESTHRRHGLYNQLASDLRSENFQAFLLEESFRELVVGASERLHQVSGRYTLDYAEGLFFVLDHDNAGERRSADTVSGGETFLASLALALELSEQVQRAAGAIRLDSLFIDEGFGTLDPETLDTVAAAVETLPVGGRAVGIITHIPELTERLPAVIRVEKTAEGSRVRGGIDLAYNVTK